MVVARSLSYDRAERRAQYQGMVRYSDPSYTLAASVLEVLFDSDNNPSQIEARGAVEIDDLINGWRMTGLAARRDMGTQTVSLDGEPAQLRDEKGNAVSGPSLTWNQASGTVTVAGGTETIYYPEESP
jgi:lipopolysaccharide export system protein LptA